MNTATLAMSVNGAEATASASRISEE